MNSVDLDMSEVDKIWLVLGWHEQQLQAVHKLVKIKQLCLNKCHSLNCAGSNMMKKCEHQTHNYNTS